MLARNGAGLDFGSDRSEARKVVSFGKRDKPPSKPSPRSPQDAIRAELVGADECTIAAGITARGKTPILALCRKLIEGGCDPGRRLQAYRGATLCVTVRTIAEGARLTVDEHNGAYFGKWKPFNPSAVSSPVRQNASGDTGWLDWPPDEVAP
jgi:hypothetical protein